MFLCDATACMFGATRGNKRRPNASVWTICSRCDWRSHFSSRDGSHRRKFTVQISVFFPVTFIFFLQKRKLGIWIRFRCFLDNNLPPKDNRSQYPAENQNFALQTAVRLRGMGVDASAAPVGSTYRPVCWLFSFHFLSNFPVVVFQTQCSFSKPLSVSFSLIFVASRNSELCAPSDE